MAEETGAEIIKFVLYGLHYVSETKSLFNIRLYNIIRLDYDMLFEVCGVSVILTFFVTNSVLDEVEKWRI